MYSSHIEISVLVSQNNFYHSLLLLFIYLDLPKLFHIMNYHIHLQHDHLEPLMKLIYLFQKKNDQLEPYNKKNKTHLKDIFSASRWDSLPTLDFYVVLHNWHLWIWIIQNSILFNLVIEVFFFGLLEGNVFKYTNGRISYRFSWGVFCFHTIYCQIGTFSSTCLSIMVTIYSAIFSTTCLFLYEPTTINYLYFLRFSNTTFML